MTPCILELGNDRIEAGVLPEVGGRLVYLRRPGGNNVLKSDPLLWGKRSRRIISADTVYVSYNGHEVWLGPQSQWWAHQEFRPALKRKKAQWPPDPYLTMAPCSVVKHTQTELVLQSPDSPITGMRLTKTISIDKDGGVGFRVDGTNISSKPVSWDLWLNTRAGGYAKCYVPVHNESLLRIAGVESAVVDKMDYKSHGGYFSFVPCSPSASKRTRWAKAFIHPARPVMYAFTDRDLLEISIQNSPAASIHAEQALVEIFNMTSVREPAGLLELECHGPYKTLKPKESMTVRERFRVIPYKGGNTASAHCRFLDSLT